MTNETGVEYSRLMRSFKPVSKLLLVVTTILQLSTAAAADSAAHLPNELFAAVRAGSTAEVERLLGGQDLTRTLNDDGDTPLGLALAIGAGDVARTLLRVAGPPDLRHRNFAGEGYVFLAARAGLPDVVGQLAQAHFETLGSLNRFDFSAVDRRTRAGQRALFVAADRAVAETLETQHYRGFLRYPWRHFMLERDKLGQNFLHAAARDGRDGVILWATERLCPRGRWEESDHWLKQWPAWTASHGLALTQTYVTGDLRLWWDKVINRPDKHGRTPLHVAVENQRWRAVRALAHCRWIDFDLKDERGNLPLHAFLATTDERVGRHADEVHAAFDFLLAQDTRLRLRTQATRASAPNYAGDTPLHLAARLADPYFYERLAKVGDVFALNRQGQTAERVFLDRRRVIDQRGLE